jgi:hypothetical protein
MEHIVNMKVWNKSDPNIPEDAVYIGRPSKWGNPFIVGQHGTRREVIEKYKSWLMNQPQLLEDVKKELKGKDLVCFCVPRACHGKILMEIANA